MKRKPSQQLVNVISNQKDLVRRLKSPQNKRMHLKKQLQMPSVILPRHKPIKSKEELKADSNNTTTTTKSKNIKPSKKIKEKEKGQLKQSQILLLISSFAAKIQRQWRAYAFRKRVKQFLNKIKPQQQSQDQLKLEPKSHFFELKFDNTKIQRMVRFQDEQISSGTTLYDRSKYDNNVMSNKDIKSKSELTVKSKSKKSSVYSKSSNSTPRNRVQKISNSSKTPKQMSYIVDQLSRSLERPLSNREKQYEKDTQVRRASFNTFQEKKFAQNRRHSTGELEVAPLRNNSQKKLQVSKAYDLRIQHSEKMIRKNMQESPRNLFKCQTEANIAFRKESQIQKMMHQCKKQLQMKKFKKMLSIQNRYKKNQVTQRSYLEIIGKINKDHSTKLELIKAKEGQLKSTLDQLVRLYKGNHHQQVKFAQDDPQTSQSHLDVSLSFDKWDFNSSAKKSIDNLDIPEGNGSKVLTIQCVLRELDEEENCLSDEKRFKKNKSLQIIQAIAQRSKQISEKDIVSFEEVNESNDHIVIQEVKTEEVNEQQLYSKKQVADHIVEEIQTPAKGQAQIKYIQSEQKSKLQNESEIKQKQCPNINENQSSESFQVIPAGQPQLSSEQFVLSNRSEKANNLLNELIFKQIKTNPQFTQHPLIARFYEMVTEKIIMTNIKIISSLKFAFAKAVTQKKKKLQASKPKPPPIRPNIDSINAWLLEVSHFMLDNYEKVINDNIVNVKQPPISQVILMAKKQITAVPYYETIPQYVFKDFQFGYIRALARKNGVKDTQYEVFSNMVYTFHRALIDSMNISLMSELATGTQWIKTPWTAPQKFKTNRMEPEQAKVSLQRVINMVSNWAEYSLGRLQFEQDFTEMEYRQFEDEKIFLVCRQEIQDVKLNYSFSMGHILLNLSDWLYEFQLQLLTQDLAGLLS